ncbi:MAG: hypothetical protein NXI14_12065 [bacterium]|nr:hypothetical protein [bacterium]
MKLSTAILAATAGVLGFCATSFGSTVTFSNPNGLSAEATFVLLNGGNSLQIALRNTSSSVPAGFGDSDRLLTGIAFDLGGVDILATGSSVFTGASSYTLNFNPSGPGGAQNYGANYDVSGEYGFGNGSATGTLSGFSGLTNHVSTNTSHTTPFGGPNLDGPSGLGGPAGGLISTAGLTGFGNGQGAIHDEIVITLGLSSALADFSFLENGARVEFGSDRFFLNGTPTATTVIPLPGPAALAGAGLLLVGTRRRR